MQIKYNKKYKTTNTLINIKNLSLIDLLAKLIINILIFIFIIIINTIFIIIIPFISPLFIIFNIVIFFNIIIFSLFHLISPIIFLNNKYNQIKNLPYTSKINYILKVTLMGYDYIKLSTEEMNDN
jgi:hypothetical protein